MGKGVMTADVEDVRRSASALEGDFSEVRTTGLSLARDAFDIDAPLHGNLKEANGVIIQSYDAAPLVDFLVHFCGFDRVPVVVAAEPDSTELL